MNTQKKKIFFLLLLFSFTLLPSKEKQVTQTPMQTRTQVIMGTFSTFTLEASKAEELSKGFLLLKEIEMLLSSYNKDALVYKLNAQKHIVTSNILLDILIKSKTYYKNTYGYFDITIGSITKNLYHFGEEEQIPSKKALSLAPLGINNIIINKKEIRLENNITIDLGGMGKGYAVDKVTQFLEEQNISQGIIALSGDIRCLDLCPFELQSPFSEQTFAKLKSKIPQLSISTSGTYRRYVGTQKNHHLINPKTAKQGRAFVSVSLFTKADNAKIDAYATAISVMPKEKALTFLKAHEEIGFILVKKDGKIVYGNLDTFVIYRWLDYKEKATIPNISTNSSTNNSKVNSLIHPDTTRPKMIAK